MEMIIPPGGLLMTSVEIAALTSKRHDQVLRTARDLAAQGITQSVECQYRATVGGREYPMHQLTKRDSLVLVARLSPEFTGRIVDRWMELEAVIAVPTIKTPATSAPHCAWPPSRPRSSKSKQPRSPVTRRRFCLPRQSAPLMAFATSIRWAR